MKKQMAILALGMGLSGAVLAFDCNTDCGEAASFQYPCPTFQHPGRKCEGRDPGTFAACSTAKEASCHLWQVIYDAYSGEIKNLLKIHFNHATWAAAEANHDQQSYLGECEAAGVSIAAAVGAKVGGPYGAALSGAVGVFVSDRLCEQSETW